MDHAPVARTVTSACRPAFFRSARRQVRFEQCNRLFLLWINHQAIVLPPCAREPRQCRPGFESLSRRNRRAKRRGRIGSPSRFTGLVLTKTAQRCQVVGVDLCNFTHIFSKIMRLSRLGTGKTTRAALLKSRMRLWIFRPQARGWLWIFLHEYWRIHQSFVQSGGPKLAHRG